MYQCVELIMCTLCLKKSVGVQTGNLCVYILYERDEIDIMSGLVVWLLLDLLLFGSIVLLCFIIYIKLLSCFDRMFNAI